MSTEAMLTLCACVIVILCGWNVVSAVTHTGSERWEFIVRAVSMAGVSAALISMLLAGVETLDETWWSINFFQQHLRALPSFTL